MLKTIDIIMIGTMVAAATITYQIKHHAEDKLEEVHKLEAEIKLEHDTIDLLKADWALLTQPNRLEQLVKVYGDELKLEPTAPDQLARPDELPMRRDQLPPKEEIAEGEHAPTDDILTGSVKP
ncbi:cell division protein FtsL [Agrobacterium sp. ES01]|uniref:cell division protein FtsL n=1 Tax=Agrobacterium sp. ES01 TaxID=3420714 RepID=UPI003D09EB14